MSNKDILLVKKKMSVELEPKKLYVKNIDRSVSDDQLKDYFSQFGEVVFARIPRKFGKSR
jgi:RNA recognition motif-containing protein